jgi:long-chain fatty acid transport protein
MYIQRRYGYGIVWIKGKNMKSARTLRRTFFISLAAALLLAGPVFAGGLYITEFGDPSQGASGAGAGALGQDASTAFHNPAGIMMLEANENHWMVSAIYVDPSMKFSKESGTTVPPLAPGEGNGGDAGVSAVGGGFWWARPINDKFGFGFALYSLSAAAMDYKSGNTNANDFVGRYWSTEVDLLTVNLMPSVAWRINDQWSVGFAVPIQVGQLDLTVAVPTVGPPHFPATDGVAQISNGDDVSATVSLSVLWEATDRLRFGAAYMGENELSFSSDLAVNGPMGNPLPLPINSADVTIPFVQTVRVWGSSDLGDRLTVLASVAWEDWSSFDNLLISTDAGTGALVRDWKDTWKFGLGLRWRTAGAWTHYTGIAYDSSPTSASKRTADMPMDEQWRFSIGTNYAFNNGVKLGGVITYADYGEARIDNGGDWGTVVGKYSTNRIWFLGANIGW